MTETDHHIKRMIISLDSCALSSLQIESAVSLASLLQVELCGLYIENTALLALADLPFTREITLHTAEVRDLSSQSVERSLKLMATGIRQRLDELAKIHRVVYTFRTVRGLQPESVIRESVGYQLIMIMPEKRLSREVSVRTVSGHAHSVMLFYDESAQARSALRVARALDDNAIRKSLQVLITSQSAQQEIMAQFASSHYHIEFTYIPDCNLSEIISLAKQRFAGHLILPLEDRQLQQEKEITHLLNSPPCPLIIVR